MMQAGSTGHGELDESRPAIVTGRRYHVGTLSYSRGSLLSIFSWLLWGDLCLNLMESVIPRLVPLQLQALGASSAVIGLLTGSLFSAMSWVMTPVLSTWSDRFRSRLGRRIPFLLFPTPVLACCLILVGCADTLAPALHSIAPRLTDLFSNGMGHVIPSSKGLGAQARLAIGVFATTLLIYRFFDLFPQTAYYYLLPDVVPAPMMGRFVCLFRMTATLGAALFNFYLLRYAPAHNRTLYVGCAMLYLVAFVSMSLVIKEGDYPPPPPRPKHPLAGLAAWGRESFSHPFYWTYFLTFSCFRWATVPFNAFVILYAQKQLHMQPARFGHTMGILLAMQLPVLLVLGPILDRFHPVRIGLVGYVLLLIGGTAGFLFIRGETSFFITTAVLQVGVAVFQGTLGTLAPRILPPSHHGQFCAATSMVGDGGLLLLSPLCGLMLDRFGQPYLYGWVALFAAVGITINRLLLAEWTRRGGDDAYVCPPVTAAD